MSFGKFKDDSSSDRPIGSSTSPITSSTSPKSDAYLGKGTRVVGSLSFNGPVELDGVVEGEVVSKETLTIGESAVISAKLQGSEIIIRGTVTGDIVASRKLSLRKPAKVTGNISSPTLSIEDGVHFEGKCIMTSGSSSSVSSAQSSSSDAKGVSATTVDKHSNLGARA